MALPATGTGATVYFIVGLYFLMKLACQPPLICIDTTPPTNGSDPEDCNALPKLAVKRLTLFVPYFVNTPANQSATTAVPSFLIAGLPAAASHSEPPM